MVLSSQKKDDTLNAVAYLWHYGLGGNNLEILNSRVLTDFPAFLDFVPPSPSALKALYVNMRSIIKHWNAFRNIVEAVDFRMDVFVRT